MYVDGLVQACSNSIANALELLQSCTKPSMWKQKKVKTKEQMNKEIQNINKTLHCIS